MAYSCYWQLLIHFLAILRMLGKTPLWNDVLINFAKGVKITSLICFITFFGMLLGRGQKLCQISLFISSGCDEKCFLVSIQEEVCKTFLVGKILFCIFVLILVKNLLKCSTMFSEFVIVFPSSIREVEEFNFFLFCGHIISLIPIHIALQLFLFSSKYLL